MRKIASLYTIIGLLCWLCLGGVGALFGQNIAVEVDGVQKSGANLKECLEGISAITSLKVTGGEFTEADWGTLRMAKQGSATALKSLEFADVVKVGKMSMQMDGDLSGLTGLENVLFGGFTPVVIGDYAFKGCLKLSKVVLPKGCRAISNNAFDGCIALNVLDFPETLLKIDREAFQGTGLTSVALPQNLRELWARAFKDCKALENVEFRGTEILNTDRGGASGAVDNTAVFEGCEKLGEVFLPWDERFSASTPCRVPDGYFKGCTGLGRVNLPSSLQEIGANAFEGCSSLRELALPENVSKIGASAFKGCANLQKVSCLNGTVPSAEASIFEGVDLAQCRLYVPEGSVATYEGAEVWKEFATDNVLALNKPGTIDGTSTLDLPEAGAQKLNFLSFLSGYDVMMDDRVSYSVEPEGVVRVEKWGTLSNILCVVGLKEGKATITIECLANPSVTSTCEVTVGATAGTPLTVVFNRGSKEECTVTGGSLSLCLSQVASSYRIYMMEVTEGAFKEDDWRVLLQHREGRLANLQDLTFAEPVTVADAPDALDDGDVRGFCSATLSSLRFLGSTPRRLGNRAFFQTLHLMKVSLPSGLMEIGAQAFDNCQSLEGIVIPEGVERIADAAFGRCGNLTSVQLPKSLKHIGSSNFNGGRLARIALGNELQSIGKGSLANGLYDRLVLPASLETIEAGAFADCEQLTEVVCLLKSPIALEGTVFKRPTSLKECTLYVPQGTKAEFVTAQVWQEFTIQEMLELEGITLSESQLTLMKGMRFPLNATPKPDKGADSRFVWSVVPAAGIVSVGQDGMVTALGVGEAVVKVTSVANPSISAECKVTVVANEYTLTLQVRDAAGHPVEGATVELAPKGGSSAIYTMDKTDAQGITKRAVAEGIYTCTVKHPDHPQAASEITVDGDKIIEVALDGSGTTPTPTPTPKPGEGSTPGGSTPGQGNGATPVLVKALAEVSVAPNPVRDEVRVLHAEKVQGYRLYDAMGRLVVRGEHTGDALCVIPAHALKSGLYLLNLLDSEGGSRLIRVVKR